MVSSVLVFQTRLRGYICLGSQISSGPESHLLLMRASHLALLLDKVADVEVSLSPCFLAGEGLWCQQPKALSRVLEVLETAQLSSKPVATVMCLWFVNQEWNVMSCCSSSLQNQSSCGNCHQGTPDHVGELDFLLIKQESMQVWSYYWFPGGPESVSVWDGKRLKCHLHDWY